MIRSRGRYHVPVVFKRYPKEVETPALAPVGRSDMPIEVVFRLRVVDTAPALERIRAERSNVEAEISSLKGEGDPKAQVLRQEGEAASQLERGIISRSTHLWESFAGVILQGESGEEAERRAKSIKDELSWMGYRFYSPRHRSMPLFEALAPATPFPTGLSHPLTDDSLAALLPIWEDSLEEDAGVLLGIHPVQGTPLFWDRFSHKSHSSAVFGETGSGKTYASALGWMRLRYRHPDLSVFVIDPLGGLAELVRGLGGQVYSGGAHGLSINPLDPSTAGGDARARTSMATSLLRTLFPSISDEEAAILDTTLTKLYSDREGMDPPLLRDLCRALSDSQNTGRLTTLLGPLLTGSLGSLDSPTSIDLSSNLIAFDLSATTASEMPFFLTLILDHVYGEIRRRPGMKLLVVDEAHYMARNEMAAEFLDYLVRHLRHFNAGLELITQNPEDFLGSERTRSILLNLDSVLLLRLKDGGERVGELLGLTLKERDALKSAAMPASSGYAEGIFRTETLHLPLAIIGSEVEHRKLTAAFTSERERRSKPRAQMLGAPPP